MDERKHTDEQTPQPAADGGGGPSGSAQEYAGAGQARPDVRDLEDRVQELEDRWRRAMAELDNQRKRYERQFEQVRRAERDQVTTAWLPLVDHLELALQHAQADPASIVAGVRAVHDQALGVLVALGYRRLDQVGARFDPTVHEAAQVVVDPDSEPNTIVSVLRPGYAADGGLLRPAVVTVATGSSPAGEGSAGQE